MRRTAKTINSFDSTSIYYEVASGKQKPTLIFLHGLGGDLTAWNVERAAFEKIGYPTIAIDLRGHGLSGRPDKEQAYNLSHFCRDILLIIKHERLNKPVIIGHCLGGMVALTLLGTHQHIARALILIDTSYKPPFFAKMHVHSSVLNKIINPILNYLPSPHIGQHVDFAQFKGTKDYDLHRILSDILHTSLKSYLLISENLTNYNATTLLSRIVVPTLVIEGTNDSIFPPKVALALADRIKHVQLRFIKGGNHIVVINNPQDVISDILSFVKKI